MSGNVIKYSRFLYHIHVILPSENRGKNNVKSLFRGLVIVAGLMMLASCRPASLMWISPEGPAEYQLGWEDGCDTGLSAEGSWMYKTMFGFKKRPEMAANDQYKQGWNEGFTYCRFSLAADKE